MIEGASPGPRSTRTGFCSRTSSGREAATGSPSILVAGACERRTRPRSRFHSAQPLAQSEPARGRVSLHEASRSPRSWRPMALAPKRLRVPRFRTLLRVWARVRDDGVGRLPHRSVRVGGAFGPAASFAAGLSSRLRRGLSQAGRQFRSKTRRTQRTVAAIGNTAVFRLRALEWAT